jgi:UDP-3-O-[3-hydroxymyristoyl] glucosamine N-acyltransferase
MQVNFSPAEIVEIVRPKQTRGETAENIHGIAALGTAGPGELSFLGNIKYRAEVTATRASVVLLPIDYSGEPKPNQLFLHVDNPSVALARLCSRIEQTLWPKPPAGIHASAAIAPTARIAVTATIGPLCVVEDGAVIGERAHLQGHVFVGRNATIGADCWLAPGTIVSSECVLANRVRLQPGAVVGSDGFGYEFVGGRHEKVPQIGNVVLGDDVEIGANSTIDRARFSMTSIGEGTKIDNLVQIAHNVVIGRHCLVCSQTGISGSTTLEDYVVLGGQVGTVGHITIGKGVKAGAKTGINGDVAPGAFINGTPHLPYILERRIVVLQRRLPEVFQRLDALEEQIKKSSS